MSRLLAFIALLLALPVHAAERIERFHSEIRVLEDAEVEITETITVIAEGREIRRGIYRDFPTDYRDDDGRPVRVSFDVLETRRDGRPEPHHTERRSNGVRLYLGSANVFLDPGRHTYEITYRSRGQLGFYDGFDEIYWNATGNGWVFPIEAAEAVVRLPAAVPADELKIAAYTGRQGSTETAYEATVPESGVVTFRSTRRLLPQEGLTVAVGFPKGIVEPTAARPASAPTPAVGHRTTPSRAGSAWRAYLARWIGWLAVAIVFGYYFWAWRRVGRDPKPGVIIPRYEPPEGMSPAALRYVKRMKYDASCMAAALVNLAVKGALSIHQEGWFFARRYRIKRAGGENIDFSPGELAVYTELLGRQREFSFSRKNYAEVQSALSGQERALTSEHKARNFRLNRPWFVGGVILSLAAVVLTAYFFGNVIVTAAVLLVINLLFLYLLKAPTLHGRRIMDQIEGLRLYLGVAEKDTFAGMDRPKTLEEFERLLPYAVALDCASTWVEQFEDVLESLERAGQLEQRNWMTGDTVSARSIASSVESLGSGLGSKISSSSSPPGSSSSGGSSGGGSSGGGGGGGGGGGW